MKKKIILGTICLMFAGILSVTYYFEKTNSNYSSKSRSSSTETTEEKSIINVTSSYELLHDLSDNKTMYDLCDYVAIIRIDSIDGVSNINKVSGEYISDPYTYGQATVLNVIKGDISTSSISYVRTGGTLSYDEWIKEDVDPEKLQIVREENGLGDVATSDIMVNYSIEDDISIESGKTYLVYMSHNSEFNTQNEYIIQGFQYGLREVQTSDISSYSIDNTEDLNVLNNVTGEYEKLSSLVYFDDDK